MDKKGKASKTQSKPQRSEPALNKAGWPAQAANDGIKRASATHDRKPAGRGFSRGR